MTARKVAAAVLTKAERGRGFIDNVLDLALSKSQLSPRDRRFAWEMTYGVVRLKKRLDYVIDQFSDNRKIRLGTRIVLRMGVYQILFMKVPDYASVNESVGLVHAEERRERAFVNGLLRRVVREADQLRYPDPGEDSVGYLSTFYSHPEWMIRRWLGRYGYEETESLCRANNVIPGLSVRANQLRTSPEELGEELRREGVACVRGKYIEYVMHLRGEPVTHMRAFKEGLFQVQDESAVLIGELFRPKPGEIIVDMCASPGGKCTHLAELTGDRGTIVAVDVSVKRLKPLRQNVKRLGIRSILPVVSDGTSFQVKKCDGILLDVPCSGSGTLRRRPDLRWRMNEGEIRALSTLQLRLLENAASLLQVGGRLVYSTCSIEPEENEEVVRRFLSSRQDFVLDPIPDRFAKELVRDGHYLGTLPHVHGTDGIFACTLRKKKTWG